MTIENKIEIMKLILENDNAEQAALTVADIISFVKANVSSQEQALPDLLLAYQQSQMPR